jgi:4-hydroxy-tetrahydrodipicolinate synthase
MNAMVHAALAGDYPLAASMQRRLLPLMDALFSQVNPIPVKAAMKMIGLDCGECRMPLDTLSEENAQILRRCLDELGLPLYNN